MTDEDRAIERLQALRQPNGSGWTNVRTALRRRRQVRGGIAGVLVVAAALAITLPQLGGGSAPRPAPLADKAGDYSRAATIGAAVQLLAKSSTPSAGTPAAEAAVARAEQDFTISLLQHVMKGQAGNVSSSPASLAIALSMLHEGAAGRTATQIAAALHAAGASAEAQSQGWAALSKDWAAAAKSAGIELSSANSLWSQQGLPLKQQFMSALAKYYASGVWQVDFAGHQADALQAMNKWTAQHTNGKITKLFDKLDPATVLVLANAVYFHAAWERPFQAADSKPDIFIGPSGARSNPTFMTSDTTFATAAASEYVAAQLPYQGGRFAALVIMPKTGSLGDFVASLTGPKLGSIASTLSSSAAVSLPKFTTTSTLQLVPTLKAMGITSNDFANLSPKQLALTQAVQRVYLKVGEKGTEAAAVTGLGMTSTAIVRAPTVLKFDHPFLFLIRDTKTGAVLFASSITNPS